MAVVLAQFFYVGNMYGGVDLQQSAIRIGFRFTGCLCDFAGFANDHSAFFFALTESTVPRLPLIATLPVVIST